MATIATCLCWLFEAHSGALVTAVLRPGKRPTGAENAMIMKRVLGLLRQHWPLTHIVLRGDGHFSNPELMALIVADGNADFIFGLAGNAVSSRKAEGLMKNARGHLDLHRSLAAHDLGPAVAAVRLFGEFKYAAKTWPYAFRVVTQGRSPAGQRRSARQGQRALRGDLDAGILTPHALSAGLLRTRACGELDQAAEV